MSKNKIVELTYHRGVKSSPQSLKVPLFLGLPSRSLKVLQFLRQSLILWLCASPPEISKCYISWRHLSFCGFGPLLQKPQSATFERAKERRRGGGRGSCGGCATDSSVCYAKTSRCKMLETNTASEPWEKGGRGGFFGSHLGTLALKTENFSKKIGRLSKTRRWIY